MAWRRGINHQALSDLGTLTARLVRLMALRQMKRGQEQLRAMGVRDDFVKPYVAFIKDESQKMQPPQESGLLIVTTKESAF